jgi:iron complex transport system ATP-binding protein
MRRTEGVAVDLEEVSVGYGPADVLVDLSLQVHQGELCAILGPNGAGKSTLVKLLGGALRPRKGRVRVGGLDLATLDRAAIARRVAVVPQQVEVALGFSVGEVVAMGRAPHQGAWMRPSPRDREAVGRAIEACGLAALAGRPVAELSGGEQKRVAVARALSQEAPVLVLDEAGAHLDVRHAIDLYELLRRELEQRDLAVIAVLHDLNAAARYADRVALLKDGRVVEVGTVPEVMTYRRLTEVFETELYVGVNELDDARYFLPFRPRAAREAPR